MTNKNMKDLDYSKLVGILRERNKPSGGLNSIVEVLKSCNLQKGANILEIGSNTGFTSVNLALLNRELLIKGIDINRDSILEARDFAEKNLVSDRVTFDIQNSEKLSFSDNSFELVWCSNVTSFINNKTNAINEYLRVLSYEGFLVVIPIYYINRPSKVLLDDVSKAINTKVEYRSKKDWLDLFYQVSEDIENSYLQVIYEKDFVYDTQSEERINEYCEEVLKKSKLKTTDQEEKHIFEKYKEYMNLFNENLKYCGYSIIIFQKRRTKDESELFLSREVVSK